VIHPRSALSSAATTGKTGCEPLIPLYEPHARELSLQGVESRQNLSRLEADLPTERLRHPDDDLVDILFVHEPAQISGEIPARYYVERPGDNPSGVRDGNAGAYLSEVEGGDSPAVGWRQDLLRIREPSVEDLAYPREGVGDSLEVAAAGLGHRRAATPASPQYARDLAH
jgi:hypothetical protein